jgi:hypothetical protein
MTDEEYEAELQARTPEQWQAMREKALADAQDIQALQHLMWRRDVKDQGHLAELMAKPDATPEDIDYVFRQIGDLADRLRAARDNPAQREQKRWHELMYCAAMIGSNKENMQEWWLKSARDCFPAEQGPRPGDDAPLLAQATYAVECLLDAMLMSPEDRAKCEDKMHSWFRNWCGENGVRMGTFNAYGKFEPLGQVVPFEPRTNNDEPPPDPPPPAAA